MCDRWFVISAADLANDLLKLSQLSTDWKCSLQTDQTHLRFDLHGRWSDFSTLFSFLIKKIKNHIKFSDFACRFWSNSWIFHHSFVQSGSNESANRLLSLFSIHSFVACCMCTWWPLPCAFSPHFNTSRSILRSALHSAFSHMCLCLFDYWSM